MQPTENQARKAMHDAQQPPFMRLPMVMRWTGLGRSTIYPEIAITFDCEIEGHYHLPLLLSDNSYTTYRGS